MLNGPSATPGSRAISLLMKPQSGLSSMTQPNVAALDGKMKAIQNTNSRARECGTFVRASSRAMTMASGKLNSDSKNHTTNEFQIDSVRPGNDQALIQLPNPQIGWPTRNSGFSLKLRMMSRTIG